MLKRLLLATLAVFVAWSVLDFIIHGVLLQRTYQETAQLWRPMEEMKMGLMYLTTLIGATCFVSIYALLIEPKSLRTGLWYGLLFGLGIGIPMGYGTYSVMPVPYHMALVWFLGALVETVVGGLLAAWIVGSGKAELPRMAAASGA